MTHPPTTWSTWRYQEKSPATSNSGERAGWHIVESTISEAVARDAYEKLRDEQPVTVRVRLIKQVRGESPMVEALDMGRKRPQSG